jgi:fatty acid amide hydrolase
MGNARSAETVANGRRVRAERDAAHAKAAFKAAEWAAAVPADLQIRILDATVTQLLAMLESRVVTSVQLVSVFAARSYSIGFSLRAVTEECYDQAFAAAAESDARRSRGEPARLLEGIPVSIKEHIAMAGYYATCGMAAFCARPASQDALVVTLLKDAGAIPLVRSNVPQLLMLPESDNAVWGNAVNPFHAGRTPGGSSGGEGALIAARCTPLGVGTDIGGSIRIPAHFCGVYGFKPTAGRLSNRGVAEPKENGVDGQNTVPCTAGPMGRCTDDLVLVRGCVWVRVRACAQAVRA